MSPGLTIRMLLCSALLCTATQAAADMLAKEKQEIEQAVRSWAIAWERSDAERYLAAYAADFVPPGGLTFEQWRAQRLARIKNGQRVIMLRDLVVISGGSAAEARFTQHYVGEKLVGTSQKRLLLVKRGKEWKIREERIESEREVPRVRDSQLSSQPNSQLSSSSTGAWSDGRSSLRGDLSTRQLVTASRSAADTSR